MADVLKDLPVETNPNLLVGFNTADDAGIYKINDRQALVQTVDFFPPIVDDPYRFGQIAAANALSDVYAMGGTPLTALNIVGFPPGMPPYILTDVLKGGGDKIREAGAAVVGMYTDAIPSEMEYIINHSDATFALAQDQEQVDKFLELRDKAPGLKKVIYWDDRGMWGYDDDWLIADRLMRYFFKLLKISFIS